MTEKLSILRYSPNRYRAKEVSGEVEVVLASDFDELEAKLEAMERAKRHMTLLDLVRTKCQYSALMKFRDRNNSSQSEWRAEIHHAVKQTALDWHMKPGAVYLGLDDYIFVSLCMSNRVAVGVGSGIPEGHFLLTDGQELE